MAHDHRYSVTFLHTPWGYLTQTGFTQDINAKDIALLPSNSYGKYSTMLRRIEHFCRSYKLSQEVYEKLCSRAKECETFTFCCGHGTRCDGCTFREDCKFWTDDRNKLGLEKLYPLF